MKKFKFILLTILLVVIVGYFLFNGHLIKIMGLNSGEYSGLGQKHTGSFIDKMTTDDSRLNENLKKLNQLPHETVKRRQLDVSNLNNVRQKNQIDSHYDSRELLQLPSGITLDDIPLEYKNDIGRFLERLDEILNDPVDEKENEISDPIFFSTNTPDLVTGALFLIDSFSPFSIRIFATFESTTENLRNKSKVLVKWYNSNGEIIIFDYLNILPDFKFNFVWKELRYWDHGFYNVEIYELENNIRLLASGSFIVEDKDEYVSYPAIYPSPEPSMSESIFYNEDEIYLIFNYSKLQDTYMTLSVYNVESREVIINEEIFLSAFQNNVLEYIIKYSNENFSYGTYNLELSSEEMNLISRSIFYINE